MNLNADVNIYSKCTNKNCIGQNTGQHQHYNGKISCDTHFAAHIKATAAVTY